MSEKNALPECDTVFGQRVKEARERRGWLQRELAERLKRLGHDLDRSAVNRIEKGSRGVKLADVFAFAVALDVAPLDLIVPGDDDAAVPIPYKRSLSARQARLWITGRLPLFGTDLAMYLLAMPEREALRLVVAAATGHIELKGLTITLPLEDKEARQFAKNLLAVVKDVDAMERQERRRKRRGKEQNDG